MFGPLNGVRTVLVVGAVIASVLALILGYPIVAVVLGVGIGAHVGLWVWLYWRRASSCLSLVRRTLARRPERRSIKGSKSAPDIDPSRYS